MDIGTLLGIVGCLALVVGGILLGGSLLAFVDLPSILIVIGGVTLVTFVMFPMKTVFNSFKVGMKTFFAKTPDPSQVIRQIVDLANLARRESLVALERAVSFSLSVKFSPVAIFPKINSVDRKSVV